LKELQIFVMNQIEMVCVSFIFWSVMLLVVLNTYINIHNYSLLSVSIILHW
jgi:hypothetical protein